jgi:iron complex outermembrane receptor protein
MSANLPQIPPYRLYTELTLRNTIWKKFTDTYLRLGYQYTWSQTKVYNELTTPAYQLLNISMGGSSVAYKRAFQVSLGATNLLNTTYLDHLSRLRQYGVYGMGLNVFITIKANLF